MSSTELPFTPPDGQLCRYERDRLLLQTFVATRSEEAFAALVRRYHYFVTSTCMREVTNQELAADAAQIVLLALFRKASTIRRGTALSAWLFQAARFAARDLARTERRRMAREQAAADEQLRSSELRASTWEEESWRRMDPVLNDALAHLNSEDRTAVLLRYFDGLSMAECGMALSVSSDCVRMRISRALGKMRRRLDQAGVALSVVTLGALLADHSEAAALGAPNIPTVATSASGLAPAGHLHAAKGVLLKMNLLLWKPVIVGVVGMGVAFTAPVIAPRAVGTFRTIVRTQTRELSQHGTIAPLDQGNVLSNSFAANIIQDEGAATGSPSAPAIRPQRQIGTQRRRPEPPVTAAPAPDLSSGKENPRFSLQYIVPVEMMPADARSLLLQLATQTVDEDAALRTKQILNSLRSLQKKYTTIGRLDEAMTVREAIRDFKHRMAGILPDPGTLTAYREKVGQSYVFFVVGSTSSQYTSITELRGSENVIRLNRESLVLGDATDLGFEDLGALHPLNKERIYLKADSIYSLGTQIHRERAGVDASRTTNTTIWGTDYYTDDSPLCAVAVHAGVLGEGQKGLVKVTLFAGRDSYEGSTHNGVVSTSYGPWAGSYMVEKAPDIEPSVPAKMPVEAKTLIAELGSPASANAGLFEDTIGRLKVIQSVAEKANKLDEALLLRDAIGSAIVSRVGAVPDPGNLTAYRGRNGVSFTFQIVGRTNGSIWGTDTYTDDSDIGTAAVHAGLLKPGQPGVVRVTILPGLSSYTASPRNGITTNSYAAWTGSYRIELVTLF